jgi:hypothetical protein
MVLTAEAGHAEAARKARRGPTRTHEHVQRSAALHSADRFDSIHGSDPIRRCRCRPCTYTAGVPVSTWEYPLVLRSLQPRPCLRPQAQDPAHCGTRAWGTPELYSGWREYSEYPCGRRRAAHRSAARPLAWVLTGHSRARACVHREQTRAPRRGCAHESALDPNAATRAWAAERGRRVPKVEPFGDSRFTRALSFGVFLRHESAPQRRPRGLTQPTEPSRRTAAKDSTNRSKPHRPTPQSSSIGK